jgi:molybdate transport system regulatory protein
MTRGVNGIRAQTRRDGASAKFHLRLDRGAEPAIGPGKVALLEAIEKTGSISAAARELGMSYRRAWGLIADLNRVLVEPAVEAVVGGKDGGRATLSVTGRKVAKLYRAIELDATRHTAATTRSLLALLAK